MSIISDMKNDNRTTRSKFERTVNILQLDAIWCKKLKYWIRIDLKKNVNFSMNLDSTTLN